MGIGVVGAGTFNVLKRNAGEIARRAGRGIQITHAAAREYDPARMPGIDTPTLKEQGINVEIGNWRGVYGAPGITAEQSKVLIDLLVKASKSKSWAESLEKNNWTPAVLTGAEFAKFVDDDFASLRAIMAKSGMV